MKKLSVSGATRAFTLLEVLVVIGVLAILVALLAPIRPGPGDKARNVLCASNLKQQSVGFTVWAIDYDGQYPWQVAVTNGGTMEFITTGRALVHFQVFSNYSFNPRMLFCPTEKNRQVATNFSELSDANLSYFADVDAGTNKQAASILSGDRHLQADGKPVRPGLFTLTTNLVLGWTGELHSKFAPRGSLAFVDGHVENVRTNLSVIFQKQDLATNRLAVP